MSPTTITIVLVALKIVGSSGGDQVLLSCRHVFQPLRRRLKLVIQRNCKRRALLPVALQGRKERKHMRRKLHETKSNAETKI
jgi:hypothetical protein